MVADEVENCSVCLSLTRLCPSMLYSASFDAVSHEQEQESRESLKYLNRVMLERRKMLHRAEHP